MAFGGFNRGSEGAPMAEINMIPLIDVMLVLLVIFIITAPLLTHAVKVDLPKASSQPNLTKPDNVQLAIDAEGRVYWNGEVDGARRLASAHERRRGAKARARSAHPRRWRRGLPQSRRSHGGRRKGGPDAHRLRHRSE